MTVTTEVLCKVVNTLPSLATMEWYLSFLKLGVRCTCAGSVKPSECLRENFHGIDSNRISLIVNLAFFCSVVSSQTTNILPGLIWYSLWGHWVRRKFLKGLLRKLLQVSSSGWWKFRNNFTRSSSDSRKGSNDSIVSYFRPRCQPAIVFNQTSLADLASIPNPNVRANRCSFNDTMLANLNVATNHQGNSQVLMHRWW